MLKINLPKYFNIGAFCCSHMLNNFNIGGVFCTDLVLASL